MILVTIGMNDTPWGEMFRIIDENAPSFDDEVIMQIGNVDFTAKNTKTVTFLNYEDMQTLLDKTTLLVTHGAMGTVLNGLNRNIPMVVVPRTLVIDSAYDHQDSVAKRVEKLGRGIRVTNLNDLPDSIRRAKKLSFPPYVQSTELVDNLSKILAEIESNLKKK